MSGHLRHEPERHGPELGPGGWAEIDALLAACAAHSFAATREQLQEIVARNDRRRLSSSPRG